jgi:hypothetical protein
VLSILVGCADPAAEDSFIEGSALTAGDINGQLTVTSRWESGYCAELALTNSGVVAKWQARVDIGAAKLTQSWGAQVLPSGSVLTLTGLSYNEAIPRNGSVEAGFCATGAGTPTLLAAGAPFGDGGTGGSGGSSGTSTGGPFAGGSPSGGTAGSACVDAAPRASDPLVQEGKCGTLVYRKYANRGQTEAVHKLPDFSFAGYGRGGVPIPEVPVMVTVTPQAGDDRQRIQSAIDEVARRASAANGFRGAVLIKRGRYELSESLIINTGGIVVRGEGQGTDGTVLVDTSRRPASEQSKFIQINGPSVAVKEVSGTRTRIASRLVPVGATSLEVESAAAFKPGDNIIVQRTPNQKWLDELTMSQWGWSVSQYTIEHERKVASISGNRLTIDVPIVDAMESRYGGGNVYEITQLRPSNIGIEDLRLEAVYSSATDEAHAWTAVFLGRVTNAWVRRVTARHFAYSTVTVNGANFVTVEDAAYIDPKSQVAGGRRYAFAVNGGVGILFQRLYAREGRHSFVTGAFVTGPHVWLDGLAAMSLNDEGPHHRWATGLLFDNVSTTRALSVGNAGPTGTGHGWKGAQTVFFNSSGNSLVCKAPLAAMNYAIGCSGTMKTDAVQSGVDGIIESYGRRVPLRSLYLAQLRDRLGQRAVDAVTLPKQRSGTIWRELSAWKGEGALEPRLR